MFRLRSKIMLSFSAIILAGSVLMIIFVNFTTRSSYRSFVRENDFQLIHSLEVPLTDYYRMTGSWDGVEAYLQFPLMRAGQMRGMMGRSGTAGTARQSAVFPQILLTDTKGRVLVNTDPERAVSGQTVDGEILKFAEPVVLDNRTIGYLVAGSMIRKELNDNEQFFLNRTILIIVAVSILIMAASAVFSWYFASRLSRPVSSMRTAAGLIRSGDLSVRVGEEGNDELAELASSFNEMAESLEKNDQWRRQIIADSAHELRTPVSLIQGNLEMILEGVYTADEERIRGIYDETLVLTRLIEELQLLSSAESGSMRLETEELDLSVLIENVLNVFRAGGEKEGVTLRNSVTGSLPSVSGDYQKLKQVLANVLANAFHHTPAGGTVEVRAVVSPQDVTLVVEDSGPGIPEEDLEKIFERFYRTDSGRNRNHGGSGLGLAISREIVRLHKGRIYALSPEGRGASIFISLPLKN